MSIRFSVIGFHHGHIYGQIRLLLDAGAEFVSLYDPDPEYLARAAERFPEVAQASSGAEILEDESIHLVASAAIPNERAPLGIRVMQHGKDFFADKPAITSLDQLAEARRVAAETGRKFVVYFGERIDQKASIKAGELVHSGAIGTVVQTIGFGPHRLLGHTEQRPFWAFEREYYGGVINDIASHQFDQFLYYTSSTEAEVVTAQVGNFKFPQYPKLHDFGDVVIRSPHATGYIRVDWMNPAGLDSWGDVRLFILGTEGYIELRKNVDVAGRPKGNHLFIVDQESTRYIDCSEVDIPFGRQLVTDVLNRTETAIPQAHTFLAFELALTAEKVATNLTPNVG
jgi:predicted dehydrogenase